jgi:hypothetical protein
MLNPSPHLGVNLLVLSEFADEIVKGTLFPVKPTVLASHCSMLTELVGAALDDESLGRSALRLLSFVCRWTDSDAAVELLLSKLGNFEEVVDCMNSLFLERNDTDTLFEVAFPRVLPLLQDRIDLLIPFLRKFGSFFTERLSGDEMREMMLAVLHCQIDEKVADDFFELWRLDILWDQFAQFLSSENSPVEVALAIDTIQFDETILQHSQLTAFVASFLHQLAALYVDFTLIPSSFFAFSKATSILETDPTLLNDFMEMIVDCLSSPLPDEAVIALSTQRQQNSHLFAEKEFVESFVAALLPGYPEFVEETAIAAFEIVGYLVSQTGADVWEQISAALLGFLKEDPPLAPDLIASLAANSGGNCPVVFRAF